MREILFRGKRVDNGEWVEGCYIKGVKACYGKAYILPENINQPGCHHLDGFTVRPESVGQFTGILDKNGKRIFDGDIMKARTPHGEKYIAYKVEWFYSMNAWNVTNSASNYEVIGNIHDNPELITFHFESL